MRGDSVGEAMFRPSLWLSGCLFSKLSHMARDLQNSQNLEQPASEQGALAFVVLGARLGEDQVMILS